MSALREVLDRESQLTERQKEAFAWLVSEGHASLKVARRAGFSTPTMDALVRYGYATRHAVGLRGSPIFRPHPAYVQVNETGIVPPIETVEE